MKAKRVPPPDVPPVRIGAVRYEVLQSSRKRGLPQNGGYIVACDVASGEELWTLRVYETVYDPAVELDVQDVFIQSMKKTLLGGKLKVEDERGRRFSIDPVARTASPA
jgi:hypothetical protein